jgi:hypothetical protein
MSLIIKPSSIRFHGKHGHYMYNCPKCEIKLTKRVRQSKVVSILFFGLPLKKYKCQNCLNEHQVYARQYIIRDTPVKLALSLELQEPYLAYHKLG